MAYDSNDKDIDIPYEYMFFCVFFLSSVLIAFSNHARCQGDTYSGAGDGGDGVD